MTHIDESLAKGLASRFLTECDESVNQFMDRLARTNRQTSTKKGWLGKSAQVEKELRSAAFSTHWVGSNSKPALGFIGIGPEKQKFNTWEDWRVAAGLAEMESYAGARFDQFSLLIEAVIAQLGIALVPECLIRSELLSGKMQALSGNTIEGWKGYYLCYPEERQHVPALMAFRAWLLSQVNEPQGLGLPGFKLATAAME